LDEIHSAGLIPPKSSLAVRTASRDKNDRNVTGSFVASHEFGELESVHARHLDVEKRKRNGVNEQNLQRLLPGMRFEANKTVTLQQRLEGQEIFLQVVDEQKFHWSSHVFPVPRPRRYGVISLSGRRRAEAQALNAALGIVPA
jgi:hypothetical protein